MLSRKYISNVIDQTEIEYEKAWNILRIIKLEPGIITAEILLEFQPILASGLYRLAKIYHELAAEKKSYIGRKSKLNTVWFRKRLRLIHEYQNAIHLAISIGKSLGDVFAWFFYHRERELLLEHGRHKRIPIPPIGVGGKGELALTQSFRAIDGHMFLHHGITNILRFGDISIISLSDMSVVGIAEIKTKEIRSGTFDISMNIVSTNESKLQKFTEAMNSSMPKASSSDKTPPNLMPNPINEHLRNQLKGMGKVLTKPEPDQRESIELDSNIEDLLKIFENLKYTPIAVHKMGRSQVIIRMDLRQSKLADRIFNGPNPSLIHKVQGLIETTIEITVEEKALNRLYVGEPYNPSPKYQANPSLIPLFWRSVDLKISEALLFHKIILFSAFNPGHFLWEIQKLGFEISNSGHHFLAKKQIGEGFMQLENLQYYFDLIVLGFFSESSLIEIISRVVEGFERGDIPNNARVQLSIIEQIFKQENGD